MSTADTSLEDGGDWAPTIYTRGRVSRGKIGRMFGAIEFGVHLDIPERKQVWVALKKPIEFRVRKSDVHSMSPVLNTPGKCVLLPYVDNPALRTVLEVLQLVMHQRTGWFHQGWRGAPLHPLPLEEGEHYHHLCLSSNKDSNNDTSRTDNTDRGGELNHYQLTRRCIQESCPAEMIPPLVELVQDYADLPCPTSDDLLCIHLRKVYHSSSSEIGDDTLKFALQGFYLSEQQSRPAGPKDSALSSRWMCEHNCLDYTPDLVVEDAENPSFFPYH